MVTIEEIIHVVQGIVLDSVSPAPGALTILTLARVLLSQGLLSEKEGEEEPTDKQIEYLARLLKDHPESFEIKKIGNEWTIKFKDN